MMSRWWRHAGREGLHLAGPRTSGGAPRWPRERGPRRVRRRRRRAAARADSCEARQRPPAQPRGARAASGPWNQNAKLPSSRHVATRSRRRAGARRVDLLAVAAQELCPAEAVAGAAVETRAPPPRAAARARTSTSRGSCARRGRATGRRTSPPGRGVGPTHVMPVCARRRRGVEGAFLEDFRRLDLVGSPDGPAPPGAWGVAGDRP